MSLRSLACFLILPMIVSACAQNPTTEQSVVGTQTPVISITEPDAGMVLTEQMALPPTSTRTQPPALLPTPVESQPLAGEAQSTSLSVASPRYRLQAGSPVALANFVVPEAGCNWLGVGGQAFNFAGNPVTMLVVEVGGRLEGQDIFHLALTGSSTLLGPGGFVIALANHGVNTSGDLWIILYDLAGVPLTGKIYFPTYADCTKNFLLINFAESAANDVPPTHLPIILR